ncbi:sodium-dependent bicarbonate transport family permease [Candidatus Viridilinea mediisalina]|uniref:Sodium-dependent bicarbonate transport family permease n=1 Tax=Candidatus Viridilinea mediisalina TaxID=2024553 RepID=A0A2A6RG53_9CHLR|nr:sodium-dependent bicarbonate transport family permease [Candidatus Viridilinea mediisalina]PDW02047.1 sodium-dependent bicarbonate transport family permease [Candidatus Viridilinea mediisalina]
MEIIELVRLNLFSPMVLAFVLGVVATLVRSDLKFPDEIYTALSIYLLLAIGLKGGAELSETALTEFWAPALMTLILGVTTPIVAYVVLRRLGGLEVADAAALAAHYGSVSAVTFAAVQTFLQALEIPYEGFMATLVAILEVPAIIVALIIARVALGQGGNWGEVLRELLAGKSILLLLGGMFIGLIAGKAGLEQVAPVFVDPFKGILTLFLLEMGMVAARRFRDLRRVGFFLIAFGILMPIVNGTFGIWLGSLAGLSQGGAVVLGTLAASASYIAAPAAVRIALPQANPSYYLTAALAITFPFNLAIGIPLYYGLAGFFY